MTTAEPYPTLTIPSHQLYEIAHLATYIAGALSRRRQALENGQRIEARAAARDVHLGRQAMAAATADPSAATSSLPRPIDTATYELAERLHETSTHRRADVVSLVSQGRGSWAVTGFVPGVGKVGAEVAHYQQAAAIKEHFLTQPADLLTDWAVTSQPLLLDRAAVRDRQSLLVEASQAARDLDPANPQHIALAKHLRHGGPLDSAIRERFRGVDLDGPVPQPMPGDAQTEGPPQTPAGSGGESATQRRHETAVQRATTTNPVTDPATAAVARAQVALTPTASAVAKAGNKQQSGGQPARPGRSASRTTPAQDAPPVQQPRPNQP